MNARNNIFQILRQEDKIKRKSKQLKESQQKKENEKKDASSFSFDVSAAGSWRPRGGAHYPGVVPPSDL